VTSAFGGVTDRLLAAIDAAEGRTGGHRAILDEIRTRHEEALNDLVEEEEREDVARQLAEVFVELDELLQGVYLLRQCTPRFADAVVSAGERLAAPLVAAAFRAAGRDAVALDARAFIRTDDDFGEATVDMVATRALVREAFGDVPEDAIPVVTGFIASTEDGVTTTLGRSGSDYTATLLGAALDAGEVVIWTDVDGVLSADPRLVPEAFTLPELSYREAAELAHFGAKVLHPRTMRPLETAGIPLLIKNTLRPDADGTRITSDPPAAGAPIKAVTAVRDAALVTLDGAGLLGVPDVTARAFGALAAADIPVLLIAQASSEGSLCFAVRQRDGEEVLRLLNRAFERECERGDLHGIRSDEGLAVVAAVGEGLWRVPGLAGRMFATLGRAHVNVRAIAEGASDHNLSCVVRDEDAGRAVQALHEAFALRRLRAHLAVVGAGNVGRRLLALLAAQAPALAERHRLNLRLVGVADSRRLLWEEDGIAFAAAAERLEAVDGGHQEVDNDGDFQEAGGNGGHQNPHDVLGTLTERLDAARLERLIVVDATPSEDVARRYDEWLRRGVGVVTPNQQALTLEADLYDALREAVVTGEAPFFYETTVGAGLGVLSTLRDLIRTGDTVNRIEGVVSGTLAFVFNSMREGRPFSEAVREAVERGLTEPDPRADLAGEDVRRKLLILARELGQRPDREAVQVQSLVPEALREGDVDTFWRRLPEVDAFWARKQAGFAKQGRQLQYVAVLDPDAVRAGVQALPAGSPLAGLRGSSVLFAFHTERYTPEPLVVRGPGASVDVTTAVLLADVVRAAEAMR
jgi:bifunctional aspartokinase / homoserine dehydrogenase 1